MKKTEQLYDKVTRIAEDYDVPRLTRECNVLVAMKSHYRTPVRIGGRDGAFTLFELLNVAVGKRVTVAVNMRR